MGDIDNILNQSHLWYTIDKDSYINFDFTITKRGIDWTDRDNVDTPYIFKSNFLYDKPMTKFTNNLFKDVRKIMNLMKHKENIDIRIDLNNLYRITITSWGSPALSVYNIVSAKKLLYYNLNIEYWGYTPDGNARIDKKTFLKELNYMFGEEDYAAISLQIDHLLIELI